MPAQKSGANLLYTHWAHTDTHTHTNSQAHRHTLAGGGGGGSRGIWVQGGVNAGLRPRRDSAVWATSFFSSLTEQAESKTVPCLCLFRCAVGVWLMGTWAVCVCVCVCLCDYECVWYRPLWVHHLMWVRVPAWSPSCWDCDVTTHPLPTLHLDLRWEEERKLGLYIISEWVCVCVCVCMCVCE